MIHASVYDAETKTYRKMDAEQLRCGGPANQAGRVLWIDLENPTPEEEAFVLQEFLPIHALSFEDVTRLRREPESPPHFPKAEEFPDYLFVIVNPLTMRFMEWIRAEGDDEGCKSPVTQLSAVLTPRVLVTHHYEPLPCVVQLQNHLARHSFQMERGPDYLFHLILDSTVDQYAPALDHVDETLDDLETTVVQQHRPTLYLRILRLKREIMILRKTLVYEREVLVRLARGEFNLVDERETIYYRNVYDHLVRFTDLIESSRDLASDLLQSFQAATANRLNEVMKVLTMISTIGLVCALISGIYGMNFEHMPELKWTYGYPFALGMMLLAGAISFLFFRWKKWI
ncbi:MAG: magnesium/cobalt transporter CorA [Gemmataceae bacterium]|nr:magnesium/cobalt transporter CorA [Gemmataceae bacterium]